MQFTQATNKRPINQVLEQIYTHEQYQYLGDHIEARLLAERPRATRTAQDA